MGKKTIHLSLNFLHVRQQGFCRTWRTAESSLQLYFLFSCVTSPAIKFYFKLDNADFYDTIMEEMDTEDQPEAQSSADGAVDVKEAETGTKAASKKSEVFTVRQMMTSTDLRKPLLIACALQAVQQFSGINAVSSSSQF